MASITLNLPDVVVTKLQRNGVDAGVALCLTAAFSLCSRGALSTSQAARLAGLAYADFLEAAAGARIELSPVDAGELMEEIGRGFTHDVEVQDRLGRLLRLCHGQVLNGLLA